jgi:hypothetical protein
MKKILIISQHGWPPKINAQILRLANIAKHLPEYDFEPIIVARDAGKNDEKDTGYTEDLKGIKCYFYRGFLPFKSRISEVLKWFFIPDVFLLDLLWNFRKVEKIIKKEKPSVLLVSTPPSGLIVGYLLSRKLKIPLVVDYADPWTTAGFYKVPTRFHRSFDRKMEKHILRYSSRIVGASTTILKDMM